MLKRLRGAIATAIVVAFALVLGVGRERAMATPVFAQAYGLSCTACHTQMPVLNSFGRYIQRTGYYAMNRKTLSHALPVFVFDLGSTYTHQAGQPPASGRITGPGNTTVIQANGYLSPEVTYKVEQLITAGGHAGLMDQIWVAYHDLLDHHGHLFVGKLAELNVDEFSAFVMGDVNDAGQGSVPDVAVGVHDYARDYDGGRWGTKFAYVAGKTAVEVAYLGNSTGGSSFQDAYDFSNATDTSLQYKVAYADPARPWEIGVLGETGTLGFTGSAIASGMHLDDYTVIAPYVEKDPRPGSPGFRFEYARATDSDPGDLMPATPLAPVRALGSTSSSWMIGSLSQMLVVNRAMASLTYYHTNQALSQIGFSGLVQPTGPATGGGPGFSYAFNSYVRIYSAVYVTEHQRPTFALKMWLSPPAWSRLK